MKRRIFSLALAVLMIVFCWPAVSLAEGSPTAWDLLASAMGFTAPEPPATMTAVFDSATGLNLLFTVASGAIAGNHSTEVGGGVFVMLQATFIMTGGEITDNHVDVDGAGVYCNGSFEMSGGEIFANVAELHGAGVYVVGDASAQSSAKHFTMTAGKIDRNTAKMDGGGVYVDNGDVGVSLLGGEITENSAVYVGGGVCSRKAITVGGDIKIVGNTVGRCHRR